MRFELDGHESYVGEISPSISGVALTFVILETSLLLGPFGIVDFATGSIWNWPLVIRATLPEEGQGAATVRVIRDKRELQAEGGGKK